MSISSRLGFILGLLLCMGIINVACGVDVRSGAPDGSEEWGYIEVRPKAHMFWWLYRSPQRAGNGWPLIMWLQGGPGGSGVGFGNFLEIGPLDAELKPRNTTWLQKADLLFVDSPVATGFSYVENNSLVATTDEEVAADLLTFLKEFLGTNNTLQENPLFIVGESYGGKPASMLGLAVSKAIAAGDLKAILGGVLLGDSWISSVDYVLSWGPLLKAVSRLDAASLDNANSIALTINRQVENGNYSDATQSWEVLENVILEGSNEVDFYNFLHDDSYNPFSSSSLEKGMARNTAKKYTQHLIAQYQNSKNEKREVDLPSFMNGVIRDKLKIIPSNVEFDGQAGLVFPALWNDFMKSAVSTVDELLSRGEKVTIYNGQVDVICATPGTEAWVQKLKWTGLQDFNSAPRNPIYCNGSETKGFVRSYQNLQFVWVLLAGHFVPVEQPCVALTMLDLVTHSNVTVNVSVIDGI